MRSTRTIDTPHGPMLFSPVLAHTLEPGDLVAPVDRAAGRPYVVDALTPDDGNRDGGPQYVWLAASPMPVPGENDQVRASLPRVADLLGANDPILRAVGASSRRRAR